MKTVCYEEFINEDAKFFDVFKNKQRTELGNFFLTDEEFEIVKGDSDIVEVDESDKLPFNLEEALNGAKVVTRIGHSVRILCTDAKRPQRIVALVDDGKDFEYVVQVCEDGHCYNPEFQIRRDIFLLKE